MKKYVVSAGLLTGLFLLTNCHSTKKLASVEPPKLTYESTMHATIISNCSPCHIAGKGNKKPYDNFANTSQDIDEILRRIKSNPTDRGFMPFKHDKLSDSTIAIFQKWKDDGLLEK